MDPPRGALGKSDADVGRIRRDEIGGGIEPDMAIEGALGARETVDERDEGSADIVAVCGEDRVAVGGEWGLKQAAPVPVTGALAPRAMSMVSGAP